MDEDSLPNRDVLKRIVVEVGETIEKKETRRVTDNSHQNINLVRRPGEGSRPLFDRDEIINGRRFFGDNRQDGRFSDRFPCGNSDFGNRLRAFHDRHREDYHAGIGGRMNCDRDDLSLRSGRDFCRMCLSNSDYFTDYMDRCGEGRQRRVYRSLSDERLIPGHSNTCHNYTAADMETYYFYEDPQYYAIWESSLPHSLYNYAYAYYSY